MSDFLNRLTARTLGLAPLAQPIIPTMFAPDSPWQGVSEPLEQPEVHTSGASETPLSEERKKATLPAPSEPVSDARLQAGDEPLVQRPAAILRQSGPTPSLADDQGPPREKAEPSPSAEAISHRAALVPADAEETLHRAEPAPSSDEASAPRQGEREPLPGAAAPKGATHLDVQMVVPRTLAHGLEKATPAGAATDETRRPPAPHPDPGGEAHTGSQPPVIRVTIGRIEVRAVFPPAAAAPAAARKTVAAVLSLDDYLKQRSNGQR